MPANVVKPGQEKHWDKAKRIAKREGRADDWAYVTGIFKRMTKSQSLEKSRFEIRPMNSNYYSTPGQVPTKERIAAMKLAEEKPKDWKAESHFGTGLYTSGMSVMEGFGFDVATQKRYAQITEEAVNRPGVNVFDAVHGRTTLMATMTADGVDPDIRREVARRFIEYLKFMSKSEVRIYTTQELKKSLESKVSGKGESLEKGAAGGKYYRRVPRDGKKGYTYYYDEDAYKRSRRSHVNGAEAAKEVVKGAIFRSLDKSGSADIKDFKALVKRYGSKLVGEVMREAVKGGKMRFEKGRLHLATNK